MRVLGLLAAVTLGLAATVAVRPAHAGYILNFSEASGSVVASGSGSIDLTGMRFYQTAIINNPGDGWKLAVINGGNGKADFYKASFSGQIGRAHV